MIVAKTRKWGSSLGVIIPKDVVNEFKLREDQDVIIDVKPKENPLRELFGMGKGKTKKSTEELLREIRGKESKFF